MASGLRPPVVVVMGVSGSGKTTVGREVARALDVPFVDADDLHPRSHRDKMAGGTPLTDEDRGPWLRSVGNVIRAQLDAGQGVVVACSALRRRYREAIVRESRAAVRFAHLAGSRELVGERMEERLGHFMPPALLDSQLETLEPLDHDENGTVFPIDAAPAEIAGRIRDWATIHDREDTTA